MKKLGKMANNLPFSFCELGYLCKNVIFEKMNLKNGYFGVKNNENRMV